MISSDDIEQQDEMISSDEKDLNIKKLRMERVFFLTLTTLLFVVTIGVLIFYPRVVENNHNSDNEDVKQMISSLLNKTDTDRISSSDNEDIEQTISSSRVTRFVTDNNDRISSTLTIFKYNNTNCPYQFPLYDDDRRISVCLNSTVIDIRQFVNDVSSIKGLNLSKNDWIKLVSLIFYINAAL